MTTGKLARIIAVASLVGAGAATPAWSHGDRITTLQSNDALVVQSGDAVPIDSWANQTATTNGGVIREEVFLDEMGRRFDADPNRTGMRSIYIDDLRARWEALDPNNQGLTPAQVSELTGNVDSYAGPTKSGTGVQPGNMGPGNAKGQ